jgi:hypothetical protein
MALIRNGLTTIAASAVFGLSPAAALVTTHVTVAGFAAATITTASTGFEGNTPGYTVNPLVSGGIRFTQLPGAYANIIPYIAPPGGAGTIPEAASNVLEADGDENFRIELANGARFNAIGFNLHTNAYTAPVVTLYTPDGSVIGSYAVPQAPRSYGYFGLTSTTAIGWAVMIVDRGWVENVAIDNVSLGGLAGGVPEPASWAMLIAGFGLTGAAMRRRRTIAA